MIIKRFLQVRSDSSMDFFTPEYLIEQSWDPTRLPGRVFAYGWEGPARVVVDVKNHLNNYPFWDWTTLEINKGEYDLMANPFVPPGVVWAATLTKVKEQEWKNYILGYYNGKTPNMVSPHQDKNTTMTIEGNHVRFSFSRHVVTPKNSFAFCNGFACFPLVDGDDLIAVDAAPFFANNGDRQRQSVLVDFTQVGGAEFVAMRTCSGNINLITLPDNVEFSPDAQTMLVVVDGRLLLPEDYTMVGNRQIRIKKAAISPVPELDRLVCLGTTIQKNIRTLEVKGDRDLFHSYNSFLIIVNAKNLQLVQHAMWNPTSESTMEVGGSSSYFCMDKLTFDQYARGLLYEKHTRAVHDYAREEHTSTFYAGLTDVEIPWKVSTVTINPERPLVILRGSSDNHMSAKAMMFDQPTLCYKDDIVLWPRFVILDFIFRG